MNVLRVSSAPMVFGEDGHMTSRTVSCRQRIIYPASALSEYDISTRIIFVNDCYPDSLHDIDLVIIDKVLHDSQLRIYRGIINQAKARHCPVIWDICNDPFRCYAGLEYRYEFSKELLSLVDALTVNHQVSKDYLEEHTNLPIYICRESVEYPYHSIPLQPLPHKPIKLLWFGNRAQISPMLDALPSIADAAKQQSMELIILTSKGEKYSDIYEKFYSDSFTITTVEWQPALQNKIFTEVDLTLMPENRDNTCRSDTKCAEVLHGGGAVVASPVPFYETLSPYITTDHDLGHGVLTALNNWDRTIDITRRGQDFVKQHYKIEQAAKTWFQAYTAVLKNAEETKAH